MTRHDERFVRYLEAKEPVDDHALHRPTLARLSDLLEARAESRPGKPLRVVSVGAGTGAMCRRLLSWGVFDSHDDIKYVMVDKQEGLADRAAAAFARWAPAAGWEATPTKNGFRIERHGRRVDLTYITGDLFDATAVLPQAIDLVIAHAVFDLLPLKRATESLVSRLTERGLVYAPITFDGHTSFRPSHQSDERVLDAYHETMQTEDHNGATTGSDLFSVFPAVGLSLVSAGGSDWTIHPPYDDTDPVFLDQILRFVEQSLTDEGVEATEQEGERDGTTVSDGGESNDEFQDELQTWLSTRHRQLERESLTYIAHNVDLLAQLD
ncbi:SAM-dependent methyltransferase [Haloferax sp. DFSO60]|uniref:SAM-dependent methyltransferase n=1 Tax=Haloferax sp. DFSO60 TaxID=3388652 RepID=UPI00397D60E5